MSVLCLSKADDFLYLEGDGRLSEENAYGNCSTSRFPGRRNAEKHSYKETHRFAAAGNVGGPRCGVPSPQDNVNIQLEVL